MLAAATLVALILSPVLTGELVERSCLAQDDPAIEIPCDDVVIAVDTSTNMIRLFRDGELVAEGPAATGMNSMLISGDRKWMFRTPQGRHPVLQRTKNPVWVKPDWAFVEEGRRVPAANAAERRVPGKLGRYALHLGGGIMIHGTRELDSLGTNASHGCIRVGAELLELIWRQTGIGTAVHIYASRPVEVWTVTDANTGRTVELGSIREVIDFARLSSKSSAR